MENNLNNEEDIDVDVKAIFRVLWRNKYLIVFFLVAGICFGYFKTITSKKLWLGEFQIVLREGSDVKGPNFGAGEIINLVGFEVPKNSIKTEVEILKSSYVLMDVFEFLKKEKNLEDDEIKFKDWKDSLNAQILRGTSVLSISYKDNDREIILPILNKISKTYQEYSGKKKSRKIQLGIDYFSDQIALYKKQSIESLRDAQKFATEQDLAIIQENKEIDREIPNYLNIESIRIEAANEIKRIDVLLKQIENNDIKEDVIIFIAKSLPSLVKEGSIQRLDEIKELEDIDLELIKLNTLKSQIKNIGNDSTKIIYLGRNIRQIQESGLPGKLDEIEEQITLNRSIYKDNDPSIKILFERRNDFIDVFKKQSIRYIDSDIETLGNSRPQIISLIKEKTKSYLIAKKYSATARLKASERPKGVLIKYKELITKANKEAKTLDYLEDQLRGLKLEEAKLSEPWELITNPTLLDAPVSPNKKNNLFQGLIAGLFFGLATSFIYEKRKKIIYDLDEIKKISHKFSIDKVFELKSNFLEDSFYILSKALIINKDDVVTFFLVDGIDLDRNQIMENYLKKYFSETKFQIISDLKKIDLDSQIILVTYLGITKFDELTKFNNQIELINNRISGIIVFDQVNKFNVFDQFNKFNVFDQFNKIKKQLGK